MTMRIEAGGTIAGIPALRARAFIRRAGTWPAFTARMIAPTVNLPERFAGRWIRSLQAEGFLEPVSAREAMRYTDVRQAWRVTGLGVSLANATAARPITRLTADRLVEGVLARARQLADPAAHEFAYCVCTLVVFGSYLTDASRLGDVDFAVALRERFELAPARQWALGEARVRRARRAGRQFRSYPDQIFFPRTETLQFLRGRSHAVSLLDLDRNREFIAAIPHRALLDATAS